MTQAAACAAAGVSINWLHKKHKDTGTSRAELLADWAALGGKVKPRARGERTGLPPVEALPNHVCCQAGCGKLITLPCYKFHWEAFSTAESDEEANHVLARVMWDMREVGAFLCNGRWRAWLGVHGKRVRKVQRVMLEALGGRPDFSHKMITYRGAHPPANALPADVRLAIEDLILERTRCDPEKQQLKAIDINMASNKGLFRGFVRQAGVCKPSARTFQRTRQRLLNRLGMKTKVVGFRCAERRAPRERAGCVVCVRAVGSLLVGHGEWIVCSAPRACPLVCSLVSPWTQRRSQRLRRVLWLKAADQPAAAGGGGSQARAKAGGGSARLGGDGGGGEEV